MKKLYKDQVLGMFFLAVSVIFGFFTSRISDSILVGDPGPKIFPAAACILIGLCGLALEIKPEKKEGKPFLSKGEWKRLFSLYGIYLLYWGLLWFAGYKIAIPVILFIVSFLFSRGTKTRICQIILYTVLVSAAIFVLYVIVMETRLPQGILFEKLLG